MALTKEDVEQIVFAVVTAVKENDARHKEDHEFIKILRIREENKQKLYQAVITHVTKMGAFGIITGILWCVWLVIKQKIIG